MIDLHCHILPGLDDGPEDAEEALRMCEIAFKDGIGTIVATPHNLNGVYRNSREKILENTGNLAEMLKKRGIDIDILPGSDVHMSAELFPELDSGVMTINDGGKFILLELPPFFTNETLKERIFKIRLAGLTPVITHPERNETLMEDLDTAYELIEAGALMQITAGSITGSFGGGIKKNALALIELTMAHVVSTDAHNTTSRPPVLSKALGSVSGLIGEKEARKMFFDNPRMIVEGTMPEIKEPIRKKKSFFSFLK